MLPVSLFDSIPLFVQRILEKTKVIRVYRRNRVLLCKVDFVYVSVPMLEKAEFVIYFLGRQFAVKAIVFGHARAFEVLVHSCE